ncbi:hypothetical protein D1007_29985 [Hordeum vulgare]|nr:hypothetical protein D1007_29985 [Hordeum vulgare]
MSWSSSTSVAPGFRRASGRSGADVRSPVRYREDAMAYEPAKYCSDLIGDLRDEVWRLKGQGNVGQDHQQAAMVAPNEDATSLMLVYVQDDLRKKNAEIAVMKAKFDRLVFLCIVFVLGLVAGKMLM